MNLAEADIYYIYKNHDGALATYFEVSAIVFAPGTPLVAPSVDVQVFTPVAFVKWSVLESVSVPTIEGRATTSDLQT